MGGDDINLTPASKVSKVNFTTSIDCATECMCCAVTSMEGGLSMCLSQPRVRRAQMLPHQYDFMPAVAVLSVYHVNARDFHVRMWF